jgi:hypothetical protein
LEVKEARFDESECRRREAFEQSMLEQQQEFLDEDKRQWAGEVLRAEDYEKLKVLMEETFLEQEHLRDIAFRKSVTEQVAIYKRSETLRDNRFKVGEDRRDALLRRGHDARRERSEWYANIRTQHTQQGHQAREQACQQLKTEMVKQFEIISRFLDDAFAATELRRDELPQKAATQGPTLNQGPTTPSSDVHLAENGRKDLNGVNGSVVSSVPYIYDAQCCDFSPGHLGPKCVWP